jgi:hypothetical protein
MHRRESVSLKKMRNSWKEMAVHLSQNVLEGPQRDRFYDVLFWLKKQMEYYETTLEMDKLEKCFHEVEIKFQKEFKPSKKRKK